MRRTCFTALATIAIISDFSAHGAPVLAQIDSNTLGETEETW